ncbi:hypothetical protein CLOM_g20912 [Closterium sp. NIES-68]|nr:hypothetical protein CLOM_g20912 [Closterium sp. NIES-68]GJP72995.1 hypothetical protein CLOP_g3758 [Closterium sp. NIES-67]
MASMKVDILFSKEKGQILYLEAGKDFIDLLMALLRMPTANMIRLLTEGGITAKRSVGIFNVFSSADKLDRSYMKVDKSFVVNPSPPEGTQVHLLGWQEVRQQPASGGYFTCSTSNHLYVALGPGAKCGSCGRIMTQNIEPRHGYTLNESATLYTCYCRSYLANSETSCDCCGNYMDQQLTLVPVVAEQLSGGFVKETLTFMVTDNLEFFPSSTIKSISLLNTLGVKSMADLESYETTVTKDHALALVQAALTSTSALNDVFGSLVATRKK